MDVGVGVFLGGGYDASVTGKHHIESYTIRLTHVFFSFCECCPPKALIIIRPIISSCGWWEFSDTQSRPWAIARGWAA